MGFGVWSLSGDSGPSARAARAAHRDLIPGDASSAEGTHVKGLVVFGTGDIAELAAYLFEFDFDRRAEAFTVDDDYVEATEFSGRPVVPSSELVERFPPESYELFIGLAYGGINRLRAEKCAWARSLGYTLPSYISPRATTFPTFEHGDNCFVFEDNTIQPVPRTSDRRSPANPKLMK